MRMTEITFDERAPIDGYGPGFFRVDGRVRKGALLLLPSGLFGWSGWDDEARLLDEAGGIDVLLVGTGAETAHLPRRFLDRIEGAGIGVEAMATPQACRTFNVLLGEGRRVGAALLPVD